ncbi:MAG TPA: hypothetical protein DDX98_02915 [Bacteroidales bacterium]|jgi:hypothetical protein|nr:hypothetical protein [Bacteroidales bacterium]
MTPAKLLKYIKNPEALNEQSIYDLTLVADQYPYFQTAQLLRIKNLHNLSPESIKPALNFTAAYVTDRKILYYLLHPIRELQKISPVSHEKEIKESMAENIADTLSNQVIYSNDTSVDELEFTSSFDVKKEYGQDVELNEYVVRISEDGPELMELIKEKKDDVPRKEADKTKDEDLLLLINKGIAPDSDTDFNQLNENQKLSNQLIDHFISTNPKIVPESTAREIEDVSKDSVKENDRYLTDTLAKIYMNQGNYAKAIFVYEKLSLKFPEKSTYFAGQIAEIKKLLDKTK